MNIIAKFLDNGTTEREENKLRSALAVHTKAINNFLADLTKLDEEGVKRNLYSLAASFRQDVSKSGLPFQHTRALLDSVREQCKERRDSFRRLEADSRKQKDFEASRKHAASFKRYDIMLSTAANLAGAIQAATLAGVTLSDAGAIRAANLAGATVVKAA